MGSYNSRTDTRQWPSSHLHYHNFHPVDTAHRRPRLHHSRNRHAPNNRCPLTTHPSTRNSIRRQPSFYQVFGLSGLLIPLAAVGAGSIAFHYRLGPIVPWTYVLAGAVYYIALSKGGTLFWLVPFLLF